MMGRGRWIASAVTVAAAAVLAWSSPAAAETALERAIDIAIQADGSLREETRLVIRLDDADDVRSWSTYRLFLEANRHLDSMEIVIEASNGQRRVVPESAQRRVPRRVGGVLFSSQVDLLVDLAPLTVGDRLLIAHTIRFAPYFPASHVTVRGLGGVAQLSVRVRGRDDRLRWRLEGPTDDLEIRPSEPAAKVAGVTVVGRDLPTLATLDHAPADAERVRLAFAWGDESSWSDVGRWYRGLIDELPAPPADLMADARATVVDAGTNREKLDRLIDWMDQRVRYVAVTVGEGNIRPSPPDETLARGWGDCKDKALLLASLLRGVGIEAHPTLVRSDPRGRVDAELPALFPFNHAITAIPIDQDLETDPTDPVADGFLFVDTTQTRAAGRWMAPRLQGQHALILEPEGGVLVSTPIVSESERRQLDVTLDVDSMGNAAGNLELEIRGRDADRVLSTLEQLTRTEAEAEARALLASLVPAGRFDSVTIESLSVESLSTHVPSFRIAAAVEIPALVQAVDGPRPSLRLQGMRGTPEPRDLEGRTVAIRLVPTSLEATWHIRFPDAVACTAPSPVEVAAESIGRFAQTARYEDGVLELSRRTRIDQRFVESEGLDRLRSLALAEHRTHRRRVRLACTSP